MKIEIKIPEINKSVNLEVEPNHSLESIVWAVNQNLNLGREENWSLSWCGKRIPPPDYNKSIGQLGVKGEDWLELYTIEEKNGLILNSLSGCWDRLLRIISICSRRDEEAKAILIFEL